MKKLLFGFLVAACCALTSCGNSDDSKKEAVDENKQKFDSTNVQDDTKFAVEAADGGMMEVELGKLAQANASSKQIKDFGQQMVNDHGKAGEELKTLAASKNITLPATLSNKNQDMYNDLAKKKGADFDKAYASFMVDDHKKDIDKFKDEAEKGNDADLKNWAAGKVPTLEHHLMMAQAADSTVRKNN
jgi:putative membrane protein